ncbi:UDP-N-acetylmuramoyl-tripeptide--D-alanyl-D-alanine ligase [Asticcacaulis sp. BYS171W]|uniref:UDP-N-acetylmuramoyl-tripeptide--D-alanyl-D-alanine ligase n=1 Tax=Asticcacaulis aquaticus TaxID=2984212 RepID=A0ABT5HR44_9CAUL|nr:UDP-N-acetylmuramoyl-tripeptide--D-alanyl-D-alanine ligase [Asticcacaulis aquaticus]MDC7682533.1 UDP-N-acetylmuramoyl-tripeptide--D-alanyl-D-alanine ligase [Asticcacaulis aquaticus]
MTTLWTGYELLQATGGTFTGLTDEPDAIHATGITFDSRQVQPGDLFLALNGERDGHDFVPQAFAQGAVAAITRKPIEGGPCLLVPDVLKALEQLGVYARNRAPAKRGAVTGSVGKTSVTQMVMAALKQAGKAHSAVKSFNNHIGVPLTLARMPADTERAVFEIGMNHADEITPLAEFVEPDAVIITTVGAVHTENFPDGELGVMKAKAEIFDGLKYGGLAILNADNRWFEELKTRAEESGAKIAAFGEAEGADARLLDHRLIDGKAQVTAHFRGHDIRFTLAHTGKHQALNAMAVLLMAEALDVDTATTLQALEAFAVLDGRGASHSLRLDTGGEITLIDESYNANPMSMAATLGALGAREIPVGGRKVVVLTDMLELGPDEAGLHAGLAPVIAANGIDTVFLAGPRMAHLWAVLPEAVRGAYAQSAAELIDPLKSALRAGDVVMIKGSNGSKAGLIAKTLLGI